MQTGIVKWFNPTKGCGLIEPCNKSKNIFLHISALEKSGLKDINVDQKISFNTVTRNGKTSAIDIKLI